MKFRLILLSLLIFSGLAQAEPKEFYDKKSVQKMRVQPCTGVALPLREELDVKEAIECDYPTMEVIKIQYEEDDLDIVKVKLYAKGKMKIINVHFPSGLTINPDKER